MTDGGFDWAHAISGLGGAVIGALTAIGATLFRAGGREPTMRLDQREELTAAENRVGLKIDGAEQRIEEKVESIVTQFHDTFAALRQKVNDVELDIARNFVAKADFEEFRAEYRQDKNRMFEKLDNLLSRK